MRGESSAIAKAEIETSNLSPLLKWAGGKRWLVPLLKSLYEPFKNERIVEPFVGGLSVTLGLMPSEALLSDRNPHLINFYKQVQRGLFATIEMRNSASCYYKNRKRFNDLISEDKALSEEGASLFYYLNRTGYNGLCRFNNSGLFNVPFGQYKNINYIKDFSHYSEALNKWNFNVGDFEELNVKRRDFLYADPPYDVEFTKYSKIDFVWNDQVRLAHWLSKHKGPVVASNQATPRILKLYQSFSFKVEIVEAPRMISCTGDRSKAKEILATKNI